MAENKLPFEIRYGVHSGPVVAGIVGVKKRAYNLIKDYYTCSYRGKINAKGKGEMDMYFVNAAINR